MPSVSIQTHDPPFVAGEYIEGDVLITTSEPIDVPSVAVKLRAHLEFSPSRLWQTVAAEPKEDLTPADPPNEAQIEEETRKMSPDPESRPGYKVMAFSGRLARAEERSKADLNLVCIEQIIAEDQKLRPGVTKFPFRLRIPAKMHWADFEYSKVRFNYSLSGVFKTPMPVLSLILSAIKWSYVSEEVPVNLMHRINESDHIDMSERSKLQKEVKVGEWDKTSMTLGARLKYLIGVDTAVQWTPFKTELTSPHEIDMTANAADSMPFYLQTIAKFVISPEEESMTDIVVNHLRIKLVTCITLRSTGLTRYKDTSEQKLLDVSYPPIAITKDTLSGSTIDLSSLLSAVKIPSDVLPTISDQPVVSVDHKSEFVLKSESKVWTNVKQAPSKVSFHCPLKIAKNFVS